MLRLDKPPGRCQPRPAPLFRPSRIVLAKGSNRTADRRRFAERICAAYPEAEVAETFGVPHNRVDLGESNPLRLHERGKQTLVLGEHRSAVRFREEGGNACPNYLALVADYPRLHLLLPANPATHGTQARP